MKNANQSILTWNALSGATSYNVYRVNAAGDQILVQNVTEPKYVIHISAGEVRYEDFAIKALCAPNQESADVSRASRVQTGPGALAAIIIIAGIAAAIMLRRRSFL